MRSASILTFAAAATTVAAAAAPATRKPRDDCPTPEDYYSGNGYWGLATAFKSNTSNFLWVTLDIESESMMTSDLLPSDWGSYWFLIDSANGKLFYENFYAGGEGAVQPIEAGRPPTFYYLHNNQQSPVGTMQVVAKDCALWAVVNGSITVPTGFKRSDDSVDVFQFSAGADTNSTVVYEGPGSPYANVGLRVQQIPVSNPVPALPPKNSTTCLTPDDYFNGNQTEWQFGFTRKNDFYWVWLDLDEDPYFEEYYWDVTADAAPRPSTYYDVEISPKTHVMSAIGATADTRAYISPLDAPYNVGQQTVFGQTPANETQYIGKVSLVANNCNLYVVAPGTEDKAIWQWGVPESNTYSSVGYWGPGHPRSNAAMWVVPIQAPNFESKRH